MQLAKIDDHDKEPWKQSLPRFIERRAHNWRTLNEN